MREFVYLDEVSVTSLLASQMQGVPESFTRTEGRIMEAELKGTAGVDATVARSEIESRLTSTRQQESQVVSKAVIQTLFRELHAGQRSSLVCRPLEREEEDGLDKQPSSAADLARAKPPWLVPEDALRRGDLIEFDVALRSEPLFEASTAMSTIVSIVKESPELQRQLGDVAGVDSGLRILDKLLAGLVPIRGRAIDHVVVVHEGREHVVHSALADRLGLPTTPLELVAVTEQRLYWKDLRRVIFGDATVRMLGRVSRTGLHSTWTPVKHVDMFRRISPELADELQRAMDFDLDAVVAAPNDGYQTRLATALALYTRELLAASGVDVPVQEPPVLDVATTCESEGLLGRRAHFAELTRQLEVAYSFDAAPVVAAELRSTACLEVGLLGPTPHREVTVRTVPQQVRLLDVEVVALYW